MFVGPMEVRHRRAGTDTDPREAYPSREGWDVTILSDPGAKVVVRRSRGLHTSMETFVSGISIHQDEKTVPGPEWERTRVASGSRLREWRGRPVRDWRPLLWDQGHGVAPISHDGVRTPNYVV
jgi:hypothetical protein